MKRRDAMGSSARSACAPSIPGQCMQIRAHHWLLHHQRRAPNVFWPMYIHMPVGRHNYGSTDRVCKTCTSHHDSCESEHTALQARSHSPISQLCAVCTGGPGKLIPTTARPYGASFPAIRWCPHTAGLHDASLPPARSFTAASTVYLEHKVSKQNAAHNSPSRMRRKWSETSTPATSWTAC